MLMLSLFAATALAGSGQSSLAVMDVKARVGVNVELATSLTDALTADVRKRNPNLRVVGSAEIRSMLELQRQRKLIGCNADLSCLAEIGGALGADSIVSASLGLYGKTYLLVVQLVDVRRANVVREASQRVAGKADDALLAAVDKAVADLFPAAPPSQPLARDVPPPAAATPVATDVTSDAHAHALWPRWTFIAGAAVAAGFAIYGATVVASYGSEDSQVQAGRPPATLTYAAYQGDRNNANLWGSLALVLTAAAAGCVAGSILTW